MSEPWTPGPWEVRTAVDPVGGPYQYVQADDAGGPIAAIQIVGTRPADARLISLAPEMAELLEKLATWFETAPTYPPGWMGAKDVPENARQARDLLARARGEDG